MKFRGLEVGMFLQSSVPASKIDGLLIIGKTKGYIYFIDIFHEPFDWHEHAHQMYWAEWNGSYYETYYQPSRKNLDGVIMAIFEREGIAEFLAREMQ